MIIKDVKFKIDAENETLREDYEDNLIDLAENLAICMAEMRKWEAFKHAAAQALSEGMHLLEIAQLNTGDHVFQLSEDGLHVEYSKGVVH
jgi:fibrillarin-like rRNA methylase